VERQTEFSRPATVEGRNKNKLPKFKGHVRLKENWGNMMGKEENKERYLITGKRNTRHTYQFITS